MHFSSKRSTIATPDLVYIPVGDQVFAHSVKRVVLEDRGKNVSPVRARADTIAFLANRGPVGLNERPAQQCCGEQERFGVDRDYVVLGVQLIADNGKVRKFVCEDQ